MSGRGLVFAFVAGLAAVALIGQIAALVLAAIGAVGLAVVGNDVDRNAARIGVRIVGLASLLIPAREREACRAEWTDDVLSASEDGQGIRPLLKALGIAMIGAPLLAVLVRYDPQRRTR